ncbi:hypothetical protein F444_06885 [Phytophthora nicotianae P1976]|uniref:Uncharacterized protein n=1 Tax=Phytophthora nicotianae P1976 TaxID=1317066 RepID=A0A081AGI6_PHYNI|nr:hypothetical protein F444_06885 [Phytophthora nicotianae P1976]
MLNDRDKVHPRIWSPFTSIEQSMMEFDRITNEMLRFSPFDIHSRLFMMPDAIIEDEFFRDLPIQGTKQNHKRLTDNCTNSKEKNLKKNRDIVRKEGNQPTGDHHTFSCYSFSNSTVMDAKGRQVASTRRRYEDSTGRLKAEHERQIEGKKLRRTWNRQNKDDGDHFESVCSSGTPDEFEEMWKKTPFGKVEKKAIKYDNKKKRLEAGDGGDKARKAKL